MEIEFGVGRVVGWVGVDLRLHSVCPSAICAAFTFDTNFLKRYAETCHDADGGLDESAFAILADTCNALLLASADDNGFHVWGEHSDDIGDELCGDAVG
jgi:hypothetical protein